MKTIIIGKFNGRRVHLKRSKYGLYLLAIGDDKSLHELFGSAVDLIEKKTGVNYPF